MNRFFRSIRSIFARRITKVVDRRFVKARFDSTQTDYENRNHWAAADSLGPNQSNSTSVRTTLARRARLERENDPHIFGMTRQVAYDFVGTGPRLQLTIEANQFEAARKFEQMFASWCRAVGLAEKLRVMVEVEPVDGESFGLLYRNNIVDHPIKLDLKVMEHEQVATPGFGVSLDSSLVDGVVQDEAGNVVAYHVLREHPGDAAVWLTEYDTVPANLICHWFRPYRPGQLRGVSAFASTLETCATARRYEKATLGKQEINANITGVIETENVSFDGSGSEAPTFETMEEVDIPRRGLMTMPAGMKAKPFDSAQNATDYKQFMGMTRATVGRPIGLPRNLITGDSSDFNFASGRMDHLPYQSKVWIERERFRSAVLDKILRMFFTFAQEARLIPAGLPASIREWAWEWHWDGFPSIDQLKDVNAQEKRLALGLTTLSEECAAEGKDWREVVRQRAAEAKYLKQNGLAPTMPPEQPAAMPAKPMPEEIDDDAETDTTLEDMDASGRFMLTASARRDIKDIQFVEAELADLAIEAAAEPSKPKRFNMTAYTGGLLQLGFGAPVVVDLDGMKVPRKDIPILRQHDPERIVAHTDAIDKTQQRLKVSGVMSGVGAAAQEVLSLAANSFPWQASIGAAVDQLEFVERGETVKVNGRNFDGPIYVAKATTLREVSFVPIGADGATSASVAAKLNKEKVMTFDEWLKAKSIDAAGLTDTVLSVLKAQYKAEQSPQASPPAPVPAPAVATSVASAKKSNIDDIVAAQRAENARKDAITDIAARFMKSAPASLDEIEAMAKEAIEKGTDADRFESKVTMLVMQSIGNGPIVIAKQKPETNGKTLEAAICLSGGLKDAEKQFDERTLTAASEQFGHSIGLMEVVDICAKANGFRGNANRNRRDALRAAFMGGYGPDLRASVTSSVLSISGILSNVANKFVRENFMYVEQEWRKITAIRSVRDFKQISSYSLTGDLQYEKIAPGGEIKHGTLGDETYNNQADSYGKLLGIDRRDLINDDLGALTNVSRRLGRGGALKLNDVFWTEFMDNSSFFSTGNGNYDDGTDTALTNDGLVAADILWQAMTDPDGKPMGTMAKYLVCPPNLRIAAWRLMNSQLFTSQDEEGANNPWAGQFEIVSSKYLNNSAYTGYSTKAWYLLCDPNDVPVIETCFLNGQEMPTIETAELDFNYLGIALRAYHDFGVALQEPRGGYKFKGEA